MPTRFWNFKRRGGIWLEFAFMLEGMILFFSISVSVERGSEEERERCFRKGRRILRTSVRGLLSKTVLLSPSLSRPRQ